MATSKSQRIGIWVIVIFLVVGTLGSFIAMVLQPGNDAADQALNKSQQEEYNKIIAEYQAKVDKQNEELSKQYYPILSQYVTQVGKFNADEVKSLQTSELLVGDGAEIKSDTEFSTYYIGWNPEGKIFDSSIDGSKLKSPFPLGPTSSVIQGWKEGLVGMKVGGVRLLTIPADKAYGEKGSGDLIPPHTPLRFVVMAIPNPPKIADPDFSSLYQ